MPFDWKSVLGGAAAGWDDPGYAGREQSAKRLKKFSSDIDDESFRKRLKISRQEEKEKEGDTIADIAMGMVSRGDEDETTGKPIEPGAAYRKSAELVNTAKAEEPTVSAYNTRLTTAMTPSAAETGRKTALANIAGRMEAASRAWLGHDEANMDRELLPLKRTAKEQEYAANTSEKEYDAKRRQSLTRRLPSEEAAEISGNEYRTKKFGSDIRILPTLEDTTRAQLSYEGDRALNNSALLSDEFATDLARNQYQRKKYNSTANLIPQEEATEDARLKAAQEAYEGETGFLPERKHKTSYDLEPASEREERKTKESINRVIKPGILSTVRDDYSKSQAALPPNLPRLSTAAIDDIGNRRVREETEDIYARSQISPLLESAGRSEYSTAIGRSGGRATVAGNLAGIANADRIRRISPYAADADIARSKLESENSESQTGFTTEKRGTFWRGLSADARDAEARGRRADVNYISADEALRQGLPRYSTASDVARMQESAETAKANMTLGLPYSTAKAGVAQAESAAQEADQRRLTSKLEPDALNKLREVNQKLATAIAQGQLSRAQAQTLPERFTLEAKGKADKANLNEYEKSLYDYLKAHGVLEQFIEQQKGLYRAAPYNPFMSQGMYGGASATNPNSQQVLEQWESFIAKPD